MNDDTETATVNRLGHLIGALPSAGLQPMIAMCKAIKESLQVCLHPKS
jgi:hypothetical protein